MHRRVFLSSLLFLKLAAAQSPYRSYSPADNILLGVTAAGGLTAHILGNNMAPLTPEQAAALDRDDINRFDRPATFNLSQEAATCSDYGMRAGLLLPLALLADATMRTEADDVAYLYLETLAVAGVLTELTKVTVQRIRPWVYNEEVPLEKKEGVEAKKSFFSGHTSASFAGTVFVAKVFSDFHPDSKWTPYIWAGSLSLASAVAYWRVRAGRHFPTDVIAAAFVSGAVAYFIPELHKRENSNTALRVSATQPMMISLRYNF
ncbi:phosphatase PAP2 family protein [candidate division KSB1 bacterium]|nr:phosphatase PAP2 family protein [candidate division KSB1 bacterium]RQW02303.1 MAG: phosphatase PAP2 family protein [candidate division KSB1 bacterium]